MRYVSEKSTSNKKVANNCNHYNLNDWVYRKKKSIYRLNLFDATGPGGAAGRGGGGGGGGGGGPAAPLPPPVSYSSGMTMAITFSHQNDVGHTQALFSIEKISYS